MKIPFLQDQQSYLEVCPKIYPIHFLELPDALQNAQVAILLEKHAKLNSRLVSILLRIFRYLFGALLMVILREYLLPDAEILASFATFLPSLALFSSNFCLGG